MHFSICVIINGESASRWFCRQWEYYIQSWQTIWSLSNISLTALNSNCVRNIYWASPAETLSSGLLTRSVTSWFSQLYTCRLARNLKFRAIMLSRQPNTTLIRIRNSVAYICTTPRFLTTRSYWSFIHDIMEKPFSVVMKIIEYGIKTSNEKVDIPIIIIHSVRKLWRIT